MMKHSLKLWQQLSAICGVMGLILASYPATGAIGDRDIPSHPLPSSLAQLTTATPSNIDGKLDSNSNNKNGIYYNVHTLEGKAGEQITIELTSSDFDPYLILIDSEGNKIGEGYTRIIISLSKDGTYGIGVFAREGKTGNYTLTWHATTENDRKLAEAEQLNQQIVELYQQGKYTEATPLAQRALAIYEEVLGAKHPNTASSLNNLAGLYHAQRNIALALDYLAKGTDIEEHNLDLNLATGSERQKRDYMATISRTTDITISLHLQVAPDNPNAARLTLTTLLRRKARILDVMGDSLQTLRDNLTPENQKLLNELNSTRSQLAALLYNPPQNLSTEQYKAQFNDLKTQEEQLEATLARKSSEFRKQNEPVTIEAVQKLIPTDAVLVEIVLYKPYDAKTNKFGKPHYAAYLLDATGQIQWVDLGEAEPLDNAVFNFRQALQDDNSNIKPLARSLDEKLMQPIRQKLGNNRHILLSPDSQLNLIPFAALVDKNNQYLVENYTITYLTTGRDLIQIAEPLPSLQSPVILANPDFDDAPVQVATKERSTDNRRSNDLASLKFASLPGTKLEADAISQLLPNVTLLNQSQASENALKEVKSSQILHLATHGFFLQDVEMLSIQDDRGGLGVITRPDAQKSNKPTNSENPLLRSGIALAGFNSRQSGNEYSHPYYWAAFLPSGDWRAMAR